MPGMDGFSVLKEIRRTSRVPFLMLTARGEAEDHIEGLELSRRLSRQAVLTQRIAAQGRCNSQPLLPYKNGMVGSPEPLWIMANAEVWKRRETCR